MGEGGEGKRKYKNFKEEGRGGRGPDSWLKLIDLCVCGNSSRGGEEGRKEREGKISVELDR